jgi:hypothetical protein
MRKALLLLPAMLTIAAAGDAPAPPAAPSTASRDALPAGSERICGWLVNTRRGELTIVDKRTRWSTGWLIDSPGGYQARGFSRLRDVTSSGWTSAPEEQSYRCGCLQARLDRRNRQITRVYEAQAEAPAHCRGIRGLPSPPRKR